MKHRMKLSCDLTVNPNLFARIACQIIRKLLQNTRKDSYIGEIRSMYIPSGGNEDSNEKGGIMVDPLKHVEEAVEFAENPEPRCPCVLLLDISKSMRGEAIKALNHGLVTFHNDLQ